MYLLQSILLLRQADTLSYPTRRSSDLEFGHVVEVHPVDPGNNGGGEENSRPGRDLLRLLTLLEDRKSTRLNSSHVAISYAVFCLKKKKFHIALLIYIIC